MISLLLLLAAAPPPPVKVAVLPVRGPAEAAMPVGQAIADALRALPNLSVVALLDVRGTFGLDAAAQLSSCADDACALRVARQLAGGLDLAVMAELSANARLELRLVDSSTRAVVRVSRDLDRNAQAKGAARAALELVPERQAEARGRLSLRCEVPGAIVELDGVALEGCPITVAVAPGDHRVRATAPGRHRFEQTVDIEPGAELGVDVELPKNRSWVPLLLALGAAGSAGIGTGFGLAANGLASDWSSGCPGALGCAAGFTRLRYEGDERSMDIRRGTSAALFTLAGGLAIAAVITYVTDPGIEEEP